MHSGSKDNGRKKVNNVKIVLPSLSCKRIRIFSYLQTLKKRTEIPKKYSENFKVVFKIYFKVAFDLCRNGENHARVLTYLHFNMF